MGPTYRHFRNLMLIFSSLLHWKCIYCILYLLLCSDWLSLAKNLSENKIAMKSFNIPRPYTNKVNTHNLSGLEHNPDWSVVKANYVYFQKSRAIISRSKPLIFIVHGIINSKSHAKWCSLRFLAHLFYACRIKKRNFPLKQYLPYWFSVQSFNLDVFLRI